MLKIPKSSASMKQKANLFGALFIILLAIAEFLGGSACFAAGNIRLQSGAAQPAEKPLIVGHRGAAGLAPENTLAAFKKACEIGVDAVELDVLLTADGNLVVHHDFSLNPAVARSANGNWVETSGAAINRMSLETLKAYDVGRLKPNTSYARRYPEQRPVDGERIPTLDEVVAQVEKACEPSTGLWIEIKTDPEQPALTPAPETVADAVVRILAEQGAAARTCVLSFDWRALVYVQKIAPGIPTVYLSHIGVRLNNIKPGQPGPSPWMAGLDIDDFGGSIPRAVKAAGGKYWAPYYTYLTAALLDEAHQLGLKVCVWTVDSRSDMVRLMNMGVDGIITNRPDILKAVMGLP
jgi:glycerophosphoryl diester phosphodiesterase